MQADRDLKFTLVNSSKEEKETTIDPRKPILLDTPPGTDLWRKPPVESYNMPYLATSFETSHFKSARVTVTGPWTRLYDQAGLIVLWPSRDGSQSGPPSAWIKTGIEFYEGKPNLSTVATPASSSSDWSLVPIDSGAVTIEIEREIDSKGPSPSLWVYLVTQTGRKAVREITWAFSQEMLAQKVAIGLYVARPTKDPENPQNDHERLTAEFTEFKIQDRKSVV